MVTLSTKTRRYLLVTGITFVAYGVGMFAVDASSSRGSTTTIYIQEISPSQPRVSKPFADDQTVSDAPDAEDSDSPPATDDTADTNDSAVDASPQAAPTEPAAIAPSPAPAEPEPVVMPSAPPSQPSVVSSSQTVVARSQQGFSGQYPSPNPPPRVIVPMPPLRPRYRYYVPRYPATRPQRGRRR